MTIFRVTWESEIEAGSPHEAAELALVHLRDPDSFETVFRVYRPDEEEPLIVDARLPGED